MVRTVGPETPVIGAQSAPTLWDRIAANGAKYASFSKGYCGPWRYVPMHVAEGPSEVRSADDWLVCEAPGDMFAALIAAAPELLDALRATQVELWHCARQLAARGRPGLPDDSVERALSRAQDAIAKATAQ